MPTDKPTAPQVMVEAVDEMYEGYANNIFYESSSWDLKLIFGQLDQSEGQIKIVQHSAITIPWMQAKLMVFWLRGQIEAHERKNGKVHVPPSVIPPDPPIPTEEQKSQPDIVAIYEIFTRLRKELIESLNK